MKMRFLASLFALALCLGLFHERSYSARAVAGAAIRSDEDRDNVTSLLIRHEETAPRERSTCGWRHLLISRQDKNVAAWAHAVDIDGAREHFHKRGTELYYVLEGNGSVVLDGKEHAVHKGAIVHIPPGVVHGAKGRMRVLVVGIPDISDADLFFPDGK